MLPPGRARLAMNPFPIGSGSCVITIGIVTVASLAARVDLAPPVTMTSTLRRTKSAARARCRCSFPSESRHSMTMFFPSTYPSSRSPCRNASTRAWAPPRYPIRGIFVGCCASAVKLRVKKMAARAKTKISLFVEFLLTPKFRIDKALRLARHSRDNGNPARKGVRSLSPPLYRKISLPQPEVRIGSLSGRGEYLIEFFCAPRLSDQPGNSTRLGVMVL